MFCGIWSEFAMFDKVPKMEQQALKGLRIFDNLTELNKVYKAN